LTESVDKRFSPGFVPENNPKIKEFEQTAYRTANEKNPVFNI